MSTPSPSLKVLNVVAVYFMPTFVHWQVQILAHGVKPSPFFYQKARNGWGQQKLDGEGILAASKGLNENFQTLPWQAEEDCPSD